MSSSTNIALNSRSMNGIISISDGVAVLENGTLTCSHINSDNITLTGNTLTGLTNLTFSPTYPDATTKIASTEFVSNNFVDQTTNQTNIVGQKTFTTGLTTSTIKAVISNNIFLDFSNTTTLIPTNSPLAGLSIGWNQQGGGETNFVSFGAGDINTGGFDFSLVNVNNNKQWLVRFLKGSIIFYKNLFIFGNTINNLTSLTTDPLSTDNSTQIATTAFVKAQNYTTLAIIQANANAWTGTNTFNNTLPTTTLTATSANQIVNFTALTSQGYASLATIQANANAWTGTNTFNTLLPTTTITATSANQIVNFTALTSQGYASLATIQANNNAWTGTNTFNSFIPTTTITATSANQIVNFTALTSQGYASLATIQANANAWTGTNTFNTLLPTTTITATSANQIVNFTALTSQGYASLATIQANNNVWTGTNTFNISLPTSSITPSIGSQLITRTYADGRYPKLNAQNAFLQLNTFNASLPTSTITASTSLQFCNLATVTGLGYTTLPIIQANANTFTNTNTFNLTTTMNNIAGLAVTGAYTLFNNLTIGSLRIASATSQIYQDAKTQLRATINMFETQQNEGSTTLTWPLSQTVNLRGTNAYAIDLPIITASQEGMIFNFVKTQSITISILLNAQSTNVIQYSGSLTQYTSENLLLGNGLQSTTLMCIQTATAGIYAWQELTPIYSLYKAIADLQFFNLTLIGQIFALLETPVNTYLVCNGASYLKASYLQLWNVIGYTYGGSGLNFNVPDYRGLFLRGLGTNTNTHFIGGTLGALQTDGIKNHQHTFTYDTTNRGGTTSATCTTISTALGAQSVYVTDNIGGLANETRPANQSVIWCIRYV